MTSAVKMRILFKIDLSKLQVGHIFRRQKKTLLLALRGGTTFVSHKVRPQQVERLKYNFGGGIRFCQHLSAGNAYFGWQLFVSHDLVWILRFLVPSLSFRLLPVSLH